MVYAGNKGDRRFTLGVSGRLKDENLVMWDSETNSLWSQILGVALHGEAKGTELDMLPAIFVGLGTWKRMHPESKVLNLSTVRAKGWYYTSEDLARGTVDDRRGTLDLGVGLRHGGDTLGVSMSKLHKDGLVPVEVGGVPLAIVWHEAEHAVLVYDRRIGDQPMDLVLEGTELTYGDQRWDALTGKTVADGQALRRFPYLPTYMRAWKSYYEGGRILDDD